MAISPELMTLARYLAGEFQNQEQALAEPAWYVNLRLWKRPLPMKLFSQDSIFLFAEQANSLSLDRPYRQRLLELTGSGNNLQVQYYAFKDPGAVRGAGCKPELLGALTPAQVEFLPGCTLTVQQEQTAEGFCFRATLPAEARCCFSYQGENRQVSLGFEVTPAQLLIYDKGIDPNSGKALWGAILGPFRFAKCQDFADFLPL